MTIARVDNHPPKSNGKGKAKVYVPDENDKLRAGELPDDPEDDAVEMDGDEPKPDAEPLVSIGSLLTDALNLARLRHEGKDPPTPLAHEERSQCLAGGYRAGEVHFVISGTGAGKSQLVIEDALAQATAGIPCHYIGLELDQMQVTLRFIAEQGRIPWSSLYTGRASKTQLERAERAAPALADLPLYVSAMPPGGWPISRLRGCLEALRRAHPEGMIVVTLDYLQIISAEPDETRRVELRERIGAAASTCKALAEHYKVAIVIVSSTARGNYNSAMAIEAADLGIVPGGEASFGPRKVVGNPDSLVGMGKESGEIEAFADSVTVLLKWPTLYEGHRVVLSVVAKGRATGASWCALLFDHGTRFLPFKVSEMDDLPERPKKKTGRPKTDESEDMARIDVALEHDPSIDSANKLLKTLRKLGIGGGERRVSSVWKTHPRNPKRSAETVSAEGERAEP